MATKETLKVRAGIAARLSRDLMFSPFRRACIAQVPRNEDGEMIAVVADPNESAAVTIHRLDATKSDTVALVTEVDDQVRVILLGQRAMALIPDVTDVGSGMSVLDWVHLIDSD